MDADKDNPVADISPGDEIDDDNNKQTHSDKSENDSPIKHPSAPPDDPKPDDPDSIQDSAESPHLPPDLNKVSEEIDECISTLMSAAAAAASKDASLKSTLPDVPISVEQFAVLVEAKIEEYDSTDSPVKFTQLTDEDSASLLEAVNRISSLSNALSQFSSEYKYAYSINRIGGVHQRTMSYLEEEFRSLLEDHKFHHPDLPTDISTDQSTSSGSNQEPSDSQADPPPELAPVEENYFPGYSEESMLILNKLAKALLAGGYEEECRQAYSLARRNALEESLNKLGFHKYSVDDVQKMYWESLEREIEAWIKTFNYCARVQLDKERKVSDAVFSEHRPDLSKDLFGGLAKGVAIQILNFGRAVMLTKRAPEKLFKFLDVYEALRDIPPEIEKPLSEEWIHEVKTEASTIRSSLGEAMISIVIELENAIKTDSSGRTPVPGGAVHPLTKYIMNYLTYACEYRDTLEQVFREHQKIERADSAGGSEYDYNSQAVRESINNSNQGAVTQSPFQCQVSKVMDLLDAYLEGKSKLYKDPSLSSIFLMNNGRYILQKIKGCSEINSLMGDTWYRKRSSEIRQYHKGYQRETWGKLLNCLNPEGLLVNGKIVKPQVKERFNNFNKLFDEIHKAQSTWVVGDEQLQSELRVSISNMVIPAYRSFLGRFGQVFTPGRQTEKYVKYQAEDIETYIDELFDGSAAPMGRRKM